MQLFGWNQRHHPRKIQKKISKMAVKIHQQLQQFGLFVGVFIWVILGLLLPVLAVEAKHYTDLTFPQLPAIKLPKSTRYQMANGIIVYLMQDRELPLVSGSAIFRTGDRFEPEDKVGLGNLVGTVMRIGGTSKHSGTELNEILETEAAAVETGLDGTSASASFSALSEDLEKVLGLFAEVIREPIFAQDQLDFAKNQLKGEIARRNDDPNGIAGREFQKLIYGAQSPYARTTEYVNLSHIDRQDVVDFYDQNFHPNNMILGIVGDFDPDKMRSLIEKKFGDWKPAPEWKLPKLPDVSQANSQGVFVVNQPHLTQSSVLMGHLGGQINDPDYPALMVLNSVLNGFGGRMFNQVRASKGLAYSVYATWSPRYDYPGTFIAGGQTRSEATVPFIQAIQMEIDRIRNEPITTEELAYAKESALNSFIFNFQSPSQTLSRLMRYEYFGYPADFIFRYQRQLEATTIADVQRVAKTYLKPENTVILVVGNNQNIQPPLTSLSQGINVNLIDVTIPPPPVNKK